MQLLDPTTLILASKKKKILNLIKDLSKSWN